MRIENLRKETIGDKSRAIATVTWEDCDRPKQDFYFETDEHFADDLSCNPHAFLIGCGIPAMHYGEKRVFVDGEVCPELRDGLKNVFLWFRRWYDIQRPSPVIEAPSRRNFPAERMPGRAGLFFSGGVDSFASLRNNHLSFDPEHPHYMRDGLYIYGLGGQAVPEAYEMVKDSLLEAAQEADITLIPVCTNIYEPYREEDSKSRYAFWLYEFMGAALASVAHAFSSRITTVSSGSCEHIPNIFPYGHHPLVDPNFSSTDLRIRHDGAEMSRFEKTVLISEWDVALRHLRVCNYYRRFQPGILNCGECEKCVRTMLTLIVLGILEKSTAFPKNDLSEDDLSSIKINEITYPYYEELVEGLKIKDRVDLSRPIEKKMYEYTQHKNPSSLKYMIKKLDHDYLGDSIYRIMRQFKNDQDRGLKPL